MRVADIIRKKGASVVTVSPTASIAELVGILEANRIGAAVVVDGEEVVGIVSERDVVRRLVVSQDLSDPVSAIMSTRLVWCGMEDDLRELAQTMTERRIRHLPVVVEGRLAGIVSIGDVVKNRLDELEAERDHLAGYVHG